MWLVALEDLGDLGSRFLLEVLLVLEVPTSLCRGRRGCVSAFGDVLIMLSCKKAARRQKISVLNCGNYSRGGENRNSFPIFLILFSIFVCKASSLTWLRGVAFEQPSS